MVDPKSIKAPFIPANKIHEIVEEFRAKHGSWGQVPVDVERIAELGLGIQFRLEEGLLYRAGVDALLLNTSGDQEPEIAIDAAEYWDERYFNRLKFSIAHELGHFVLHGGVYKGVNFESVDEWIAFLQAIDAKVHFWLEYQAGEFAGRLLVPIDILIGELERQKATLELIEPLSRQDVDYLANAISRRFTVSPDVIRIRLDREKLITLKED